MEIFEKELETLLIIKPFEELLDVEKNYVLQHLTKEEYNKYHLLLNCSIKSLADKDVIILNHNIEQNLKNAFRSKYKKQLFNIQSFKFILSEDFVIPISIVLCFIFVGYILWPFLVVKEQTKQINIVKVKIHDKEITSTNNKNKTYSYKKDAKVSLRIVKELHITNLKYNKNINYTKHVLVLANSKRDEPLCLKVQIEPAGSNVQIKNDLIPCLTTTLLPNDSLMNNLR